MHVVYYYTNENVSGGHTAFTRCTTKNLMNDIFVKPKIN